MHIHNVRTWCNFVYTSYIRTVWNVSILRLLCPVKKRKQQTHNFTKARKPWRLQSISLPKDAGNLSRAEALPPEIVKGKPAKEFGQIWGILKKNNNKEYLELKEERYVSKMFRITKGNAMDIDASQRGKWCLPLSLTAAVICQFPCICLSTCFTIVPSFSLCLNIAGALKQKKNKLIGKYWAPIRFALDLENMRDTHLQTHKSRYLQPKTHGH